jgi:putative transposase
VSRSGYYRHIRESNPNKISADFHLISRVKQIHKRSRHKYGSRRMSKQLRAEGYDIGRYRARNLMKKAGVCFSYKKKFKRTTDSSHSMPVAKNLLNRRFDVEKPNTVWCSDISYLWTNEGWLYLAIVIDLHSRKAVGWAIHKHMKVTLAKEALVMAYFRRRPDRGLIHHSDRGSQYAANEYQSQLKQYGMTCSMSRKGDCWDNAVAESFFHTLKTECTHEKRYSSREEARIDVIDYIEMFYNSYRLHSTLGYQCPNDFEKGIINFAA